MGQNKKVICVVECECAMLVSFSTPIIGYDNEQSNMSHF